MSLITLSFNTLPTLRGPTICRIIACRESPNTLFHHRVSQRKTLLRAQLWVLASHCTLTEAAAGQSLGLKIFVTVYDLPIGQTIGKFATFAGGMPQLTTSLPAANHNLYLAAKQIRKIYKWRTNCQRYIIHYTLQYQ